MFVLSQHIAPSPSLKSEGQKQKNNTIFSSLKHPKGVDQAPFGAETLEAEAAETGNKAYRGRAWLSDEKILKKVFQY